MDARGVTIRHRSALKGNPNHGLSIPCRLALGSERRRLAEPAGTNKWIYARALRAISWPVSASSAHGAEKDEFRELRDWKQSCLKN